MKRTVKGNTPFSSTFAEKFSMMFMEIQDLDGGIPTRGTIWHLEDEQRKVVALCGRTLHSVCKSVSPALAMLGTPCPACMAIVRKWLTGGKKVPTRISRMKALVLTDVNFRSRVIGTISPDLFVKNFEAADHSEDFNRLTGKRSK